MIQKQLRSLGIHLLNKLLALAELQLFLSCWAVAVLMCWGLPFSLLSPLAMIILMPFLTVFLVLSSFLFFSQLFSVPNQFIIYLLEYLTSWWVFLLQCGSKKFLISYPFHSSFLIFFLPFCSLFILFKIQRSELRCLLFSLLLSSSWLYTQWLIPDNCLITCKGTYRTITIQNQANHIQAIDPGATSFQNIESFVQYTLATEYRKHYGSKPIERYIIEKPNGCTFKTALEALEHLTIQTIYVPYWDSPGTQAQRRWFMRLKQKCEQEGVKIKRYKKLKTNN